MRSTLRDRLPARARDHYEVIILSILHFHLPWNQGNGPVGELPIRKGVFVLSLVLLSDVCVSILIIRRKVAFHPPECTYTAHLRGEPGKRIVSVRKVTSLTHRTLWPTEIMSLNSHVFDLTTNCESDRPNNRSKLPKSRIRLVDLWMARRMVDQSSRNRESDLRNNESDPSNSASDLRYPLLFSCSTRTLWSSRSRSRASRRTSTRDCSSSTRHSQVERIDYGSSGGQGTVYFQGTVSLCRFHAFFSV